VIGSTLLLLQCEIFCDELLIITRKFRSQQATSDPTSGMAHKGAWTIAPRVYREAIAQTAELFRIVQADRGVMIPETIGLFLINTVLESLYLHPNSWRQTCDADPRIDGDAERIGEQIQKSLMEVLSNAEAEPWTPNGAPRITFIGVLRYVHDHWVWNFPVLSPEAISSSARLRCRHRDGQR
jgi:hypothetical protein